VKKRKQKPSFSKVSTQKKRVALGLLLRELRGDQTQEELAEALGLKQTHISRLERGTYTLPLDGIFDVADAYKTPLISFINKLGKVLGK
jgi:transcriptional regulator with XRE-family HTH domain